MPDSEKQSCRIVGKTFLFVFRIEQECWLSMDYIATYSAFGASAAGAASAFGASAAGASVGAASVFGASAAGASDFSSAGL
jgi:hypothetical protein